MCVPNIQRHFYADCEELNFFFFEQCWSALEHHTMLCETFFNVPTFSMAVIQGHAFVNQDASTRTATLDTF